jgi:hypothetical protein
MAYQHPFPESTVTSEWGETANRPNPHRGRDYAPGGPPAPSIVNGVVVRSQYQTGLGNVVVIRNDVDGYNIGYCHLLERWKAVGERVGVGTNIGVVGNTGTLSGGRHLHFTVQAPAYTDPSSGPTIDPRIYIGSGSSVVGGGGSTAGLTTDTQKKYQQYCTNRGWYTGLIDGAFGTKSWAAVQTHLKAEGVYSGPADGVPGANTIKGMQTIAKRGGYTGPVDGVWGPKSDAGLNAWLTTQIKPVTPSGGTGGQFGDPIPTATQRAFQELLTKLKLYSGNIDGVWGPMSWKAIQAYMKTQGVYTGPIDGIPGTLTYKGLQELAKRGGYDGPIDGIFGPKSNEGLSTYIAAELAKLGGVIMPPNPSQAPGIPVLEPGFMFGIDIARYQKGINLPAFYAGGGKFSLFKCGGANGSTVYTDAEYANFVSIAKDIENSQIGHYWFNGRAGGITPTDAAGEFLNRMILRPRDLIILDIEAETATNLVAYSPDEALEFAESIQAELGEVNFLVHYMSSSVERSADWSANKAAGHPLWAAAYNSNDGTMSGGGPNLVDTHADWTEWQIWQYASQVGRVPGWGGDIDMNVAKSNVFDVFGYKAATTEPEPVDWQALFNELYSEVDATASKYSQYATA